LDPATINKMILPEQPTNDVYLSIQTDINFSQKPADPGKNTDNKKI